MKKKYDFPRFIKYTREIPLTKNGKERPYSDIQKERERIMKRIDNDIICPMNWLQNSLDKIQGLSKNEMTEIIETHKFLAEKPKGKPQAKHMSRIRKIVEDYDSFSKKFMKALPDGDDKDFGPLVEKTDEVMKSINCMKVGQATIYRLVETSFGIEGRTNTNLRYKNATKITRKMLNMLFNTNREKFMNCFKN